MLLSYLGEIILFHFLTILEASRSKEVVTLCVVYAHIGKAGTMVAEFSLNANCNVA